MQKLKKTIGRKNVFRSLRLTQKPSLQKHQSVNFLSKLNPINLIDWPNDFFNFCFGAKPTKWFNNFFIQPKSKSGQSKTHFDKNELKFSSKNYSCFKSPSTLVESDPKLAKQTQIDKLPPCPKNYITEKLSHQLTLSKSRRKHGMPTRKWNYSGFSLWSNINSRKLIDPSPVEKDDDWISVTFDTNSVPGSVHPDDELHAELSPEDLGFSLKNPSRQLHGPSPRCWVNDINDTEVLGSSSKNPIRLLSGPSSSGFFNSSHDCNGPPTKKREPLPLTQYDPDAIFGGDSDDDLYDYSDDEGSPCLDYDPGPCSPRPLSQGQPTMEGLRAWNEERGLKFWGRILLTPLSETMITPSYPHFTPLSLTSLNLVPCDASPSPRPTAQDNSTYEEGAHTPLTTFDLPHEYQWDYASPTSCESSWDSSGACSCTAEATCCDDTANPTDPPHTPKRPELLSSSYGNPDVGLQVDKTDCNSDLTGDPTAKQFNPSSLSYTEISTRPLNHSTSPLAPTTLTAMKWTALLPIPLLPPSLPT